MKIREIQKIKRENVQNTNIEAENLSEAVHGKSKSLLPSFLRLWSVLYICPQIFKTDNQKYAKIITESFQVSANSL